MTQLSPRLFSVAFQVLHQSRDAEEVVQDVFLGLWRSPERFDGARGSLLTWLTVLTRSRALDRLRHVRANSARESALITSVLCGRQAPRHQIAFDHEIMIQEGLSRLPPEQSLVVRKAYFEGYALAEIAGLQKIPIGTIKGRARWALKKLRSTLYI